MAKKPKRDQPLHGTWKDYERPSQSGRGGLGSRKHGKGGHSHKSARTKQEIAREVNALHERPARPKEEMFDSVTDALKAEKKGKKK